MPVCAVRECTVGYKTNFEKGHFFRAPKDPATLKQWQDVTHRTDLCSRHFICGKHFLPEQLLRQRILRAEDGSVLSVVSTASIFKKRIRHFLFALSMNDIYESLLYFSSHHTKSFDWHQGLSLHNSLGQYQLNHHNYQLSIPQSR